MGTSSRDFQIFVRKISKIANDYLSHYPTEKVRLKSLQRLITSRASLTDRKNFQGHITASAIVLNEKNEVLLVRHKTLQKWLPPGGHCQKTELPIKTAQREAKEETHLDSFQLHPWHLKTAIPLDINTHLIPQNFARNEKQHLHHDFRYVFFCFDKKKPSINKREVNSCQWFPLEKAEKLISKFPWYKLEEIECRVH